MRQPHPLLDNERMSTNSLIPRPQYRLSRQGITLLLASERAAALAMVTEAVAAQRHFKVKRHSDGLVQLSSRSAWGFLLGELGEIAGAVQRATRLPVARFALAWEDIDVWAEATPAGTAVTVEQQLDGSDQGLLVIAADLEAVAQRLSSAGTLLDVGTWHKVDLVAQAHRRREAKRRARS